MIIPLIDDAENASKNDIHRLLTIGGKIFIHTPKPFPKVKHDWMRLARTIAGPFDAKRTDIGFQWLENGATCILIGIRSVELTENHNAEKNAKERERIYRAGGHVSESFRVENRLMITRALGDIWGRHVGISSIPFYQIKPLDDAKFVVLASDGVWDYVSFEMVKDIVRDTLLSGIDEVATEVGRAVKARARASGGRSDNMAVVVLVLSR